MNCGIEKDRAATRMAGVTAKVFFQPQNTQSMKKGIRKEKGTDWTPIALPRVMVSMPEEADRPMIGAPMAPKATVAVLANNAMAAEVRGEKPRPIIMAAQTATGVPKPAAPSKKAPKQKQINRICSRRALVIWPSECWKTSNRPLAWVRR